MTAHSARRTGPEHVFIRLNPRSTDSLQVQIYGAIRRAVLDGRIVAGARLPSSRDLADDLGVSRTTTLLAFDQLVAEGYVTSRRGAGMFVSHELPTEGFDGLDRERTAPGRHPRLSRRGAALVDTPPTVIRAGIGVRAFRVGTPALDAFPVDVWTRLWRRRMLRTTLDQFDYAHPAGLPALRAAIAGHVGRSRGTTCTPDQVLVVSGAQQALDVLMRLLLDPGDVAIIEEPGYPGALGALRAAGADVRFVGVDDDGLDVAVVRPDVSKARLAYVTPSHQFPLGVPMSLPRRLALLTWARRTGAWVIEDDYDSEFRYGTHPVPCLHGLDRDGRVIYVGTFSKTLFPSLRLGFVVVPGDLVDAVMRARRAVDIHPALAPQLVLADFIDNGHFDRHLRRMRRVYRERLEALTDGLIRHCAGALTLRPVSTGLHGVADLDGAFDVTVSAEALARGVEAMPLSAYHSTPSRRAANALVLGFGAVRPDMLAEGATRLAAAIDASRRPPRRPRAR